MASHQSLEVDSSTVDTSRRALLRGLASIPATTATMTAPWGAALTSLYERYGDTHASLRRSKEGRQLSRVRYHRAESFFHTLGRVRGGKTSDTFYYAGIVAQLALSAHLLDVGLPDDWCAHHIGLRVAKSLEYANATGFGHECADMARLAVILTPYWVWRQPRLEGEPVPNDGGFIIDHIRPLLRALLERAHSVTGHPRPSGWHRRREEWA